MSCGAPFRNLRSHSRGARLRQNPLLGRQRRKLYDQDLDQRHAQMIAAAKAEPSIMSGPALPLLFPAAAAMERSAQACWSDGLQSGRRPSFVIVTGISTGAMIAPMAFLGRDV